MSDEITALMLRGKRLHRAIANRVIRLFNAGFYEEAAFNSFKVVDERLREITGKLDANPLDLITLAFHPSTGSLKDDQAWQSEREGLFMLMKGSFLFHRNPTAHRFKDWNEEEAFDQILLANHFYTITENAYQREKTKSAGLQKAIVLPYNPESYNNPSIWQLDTDNDGNLEIIVPFKSDSKVIQIFDITSSGPVEADIEQLLPFTYNSVEGVVLADVDNDGLNEVVCLLGWDSDTALLIFKYRNGRYEVMARPSKTGEANTQYPYFVSAQISDIDEDGLLEVISEPWASVPDDLWHPNKKRDDYEMGRVRNIYRWNRSLNSFELIERKFLYIGGR